ncbi:MAG: hypothetical protein NC408_00645 [Candidatus Gastranaerophilales bacterium]|nr:hypothetical protein [Candidatus Gastranaerophilales bacterium]MCM1073707.1 hypothetical protein [Bacteroides sp.]
MSIKLNDLALETQAKFKEVIADGRITAEEWKNFSAEEQKTLSTGLAGKVPTVGDDIVIKTTKTVQPKEAPKQERAELSWGEIGKQALKSTGKFFTGMFCDEEGFSLTKTATTLAMGVAIGALATVSFPAVCAVGAVMGASMIYNGGKNLIEGTEEYYNAKTHDEAIAAMEKAMDGGVETAVGVATVVGAARGYKAYKTSKAQTNAPAETNPASETIAESTSTRKSPSTRLAEERAANANTVKMRETKDGSLIEETFNVEGRATRRYKLNEDGSSYESFWTKDGLTETKTVYTKADGTKITKEFVTDGATNNTKTITTTVKDGKVSIVETSYENGLSKSVYKSSNGEPYKVEYNDCYGNLVKTTMESPRFKGFEAVID